MKKLGAAAWGFIDNTARAVIDFMLKIIGKGPVADEPWNAFMQFVKFGLVGAMNTGVDYLVYLITLKLFTVTGLFGDKAYLVSTVLGFIVSFFNMFYWNNKYVFKKKDGETRSAFWSLIKLFLSYSITGIIIKPLCMFLLVDVCHVSKVIAPIPIMFITIPVNFILSKLWAFKGKKTKTVAADKKGQVQNG